MISHRERRKFEKKTVFWPRGKKKESCRERGRGDALHGSKKMQLRVGKEGGGKAKFFTGKPSFPCLEKRKNWRGEGV